MKQIYLLFLTLFISSMQSFGAEPLRPYSVNSIPKQLILNANAVVRNDQMTQSIEDILHSKVKVKHAITLLNEKASKYRFYTIPHNKFIKISNIKAYVYDSNGDLLTSVKPDIRDVSNSYGELANDSRYWLVSYPVRKYPYTVEIEYEQTNTGAFIFENWGFQAQPDVAIEQSGTQLIIKKGIGFRVHEKNLNHPCDTFSFEDKTIYTWQEENIPAIRTEELFLLSFSNKIPYILTAPKEFKMGGIQGSMESWESLGRFYYDLNKDRDKTSLELQAKLRQLVGSTSDKKEIIQKVYQYLQKNTRYVSLQLGIGGYQTLEASFVEKKGYGDCKALSNYMKAMLKSVGINSYQALISSGNEEDIITTFPSNQFNHVILCVPLERDTVWLECTSQTIPFNFLGSSNSSKHVLLLTENGGKLVKTPNYRTINNKTTSNFSVKVDIAGNASIKGKIQFDGVSYQTPKQMLANSKEDRENYINSLLASPNIIINDINYKEEYKGYPSLIMSCNLTVRDFVAKTRKRMVFNPYLFDPTPFMSKITEEDFEVRSFKTITDSVTYSFPFGYKIEHIPAPAVFESKFGKFKMESKLNKDNLVVSRTFEYYENSYNQEEMVSFIEFINNIAASDRQSVILIKE